MSVSLTITGLGVGETPHAVITVPLNSDDDHAARVMGVAMTREAVAELCRNAEIIGDIALGKKDPA